MKIVQLTSLLIASAFLYGCTTPTKQQHSYVPISKYREVAKELHFIRGCPVLGFAEEGIMMEGQGYTATNRLGAGFNRDKLISEYNKAAPHFAPMLESAMSDLSEIRNNSNHDVPEENVRELNEIKELCQAKQVAFYAERERLERVRANAAIQNRAMNQMVNTLSNMGNMAAQSGRNAMQITQPIPYQQPNFGTGNSFQNGNRSYLINTPSGLIQRNCVDSGQTHSLCF